MPGRVSIRPAFLSALILFSTLVFAGAASAQSCTINATDIAFGLVDVLPGAASDASASLSVRCTGKGSRVVRVCVNLGYLDGDIPGTASRNVASGPDKLAYQLYSDPARTQIWGSWLQGGPRGLELDMVLSPDSAGASAIVERAIYGRIMPGQKSAAPLRYSAQFAGLNAAFTAQYASGVPCESLVTGVKSFSFYMSARVPPRCSVSTGLMDFGTQTSLSVPIDSASSFGVLCSRGLPYNIEVNGGRAVATDPARRRMLKGEEFIEYGLYRDAARTQVWGSTRGLNVFGAMGSGISQAVPVYGRVHPQSTPSAGVYTDTVIVTLTY